MTEPKIPEMRIGLLEGLWTVAMADQHGWVKVGTWEGLPDHTVANWRPIAPLPDDETEWEWGYQHNGGRQVLGPVSEEWANHKRKEISASVWRRRATGQWVEVKQS